MTLLMIGGGVQMALGQNDEAPERSLIGACRVALTQRNCTTGEATGGPFKGLYMFNEDGTMTEWLTNAAVLPTRRSPGIGVWKREHGSREYSYSIIFNRYDANGLWTGTQRGTAQLVLGESGDKFATNSRVQIWTTDEPPPTFSCSTIEAVRYEITPIVPQ